MGTGDAAIAAKNRAESFGAVDSDIFLESVEPTLYDIFNEAVGEPKLRKKRSKAQSLTNQEYETSHDRVARSEKGGSSFSTDREPPDRHYHFDDAKEPSIIQWDGPTGIRLAMHRYDTFNGSEWTQSEDLSDKNLKPVRYGEDIWFFDLDQRVRIQRISDPDAVSVGLVKIIQLDSIRLPVPMMTRGRSCQAN